MNRPVDNAKQEIPEETDYVHVIDLSNVLTVDRLHPVQTTGSLYRPVLPLLHRHRKLVSLLLFLSWSICLSASLFPFSLPSVSVPLSVCLSVCPVTSCTDSEIIVVCYHCFIDTVTGESHSFCLLCLALLASLSLSLHLCLCALCVSV